MKEARAQGAAAGDGREWLRLSRLGGLACDFGSICIEVKSKTRSRQGSNADGVDRPALMKQRRSLK